MAAPSSTPSTPEELYAAPTDVAPPTWIFPPALNRGYVAEFNARLPPSSERRAREDGEVALLPPSPFSDNYRPPDIILDSISNLEYGARTEIPESLVGEGFARNDDQPVRVGDRILLDWEGSDAKTVRMTCHLCGREVDRPFILETCENLYRNPIDSIASAFSGTINSNGTFSEDKFKAPNPWDAAYDPAADEMPLPKIEPRTTFTVPSLPESRGPYVCMFTLNWDPWTFSSDHSVPFPVFGQERGYANPWKFDPEFPTGTPVYAPVSSFTTSYWSSSSSSSSYSSMYTSPPMPSASYAEWLRSQSKNDSTETAVGASFGAILGLVLVGVIFYACCKASHKENQKNREIAAAARNARGGTAAGQAPQRPVLRPGFDTDGTIEVPPPSYAEVIRTTRPPPRFR